MDPYDAIASATAAVTRNESDVPVPTTATTTLNITSTARGIFMLARDWQPPFAPASTADERARAARVVEQLREPLSTLPMMLLQLTITLFSADNYPNIMYSSFACRQTACGPVAGTLFFVAFIVVGHITL